MSEPVDKQTTRLVVTDSVCEPPVAPSAQAQLNGSSEVVGVEATLDGSEEAMPSEHKAALQAQNNEASQAQPEASTPIFARVGGVDFSNREHAKAVIKDLPADEFLRLVEGASPEELQSLLTAADAADLGRCPTPNPFSRLFAPLSYKPQEAMNIISWWESRRLFYNVIVGLAGCVSLVFLRFLCMNHIFDASPLGGVLLMLWGTFCVAVMANVCYTAGCICDSFARYFWKDKAESFGPILFSLGLIFSLMVVALPIFASVVLFL